MAGPGPFSPHSASPADLRARLAADRERVPYLVYRDGEGSQHIFTLAAERAAVTVGRSSACDVCVSWDAEVSRVHAKLERLGGDWTIADDHLSRNGTFVNGERIHGHARLHAGDVVRCGVTEIGFAAPQPELLETAPPSTQLASIELSPAQRRVLIALCRPFAPGNPFPRPSTNQEIADDLALSVPAVKTQLRVLFERFAVEDLPHNQKRARLAELAMFSGAVSVRDIVRP